jgi:hypothetical protein
MTKRRAIIFSLLTLSLLTASLGLWAADKYTGPRPPKPDLPYLLHANALVPVEASEAKPEGGKKDQSLYNVNGGESPAKTPLAEPIFLLQSEKVLPERLELYRLTVKNGHREIVMSRKNGARPLNLTVNKIDGRLYRLEAGEPLENGQYSLSPNDSNQVFCFEVF